MNEVILLYGYLNARTPLFLGMLVMVSGFQTCSGMPHTPQVLQPSTFLSE